MSKSLDQLNAQIAALEAERHEMLRPQVLEHIRREVKSYGFTADQVFGQAAPTKQAAKPAKKKSKARYKDDAGNTWSGFGKRPKWLVDGIAGGKSLEDFAV